MIGRLALARVVHAPDSPATDADDATLLRIANTWLRRRAAGFEDELLFIGSGYADDEALRDELARYGLDGAARDLVDWPQDADDEAVGHAVGSWIDRHHPQAVPLANLRAVDCTPAYPDSGWWWIGLQADAPEAAEQGADALSTLLPRAFSDAAATWAAIALSDRDGKDTEGSDFEAYEVAMRLATLARWLEGFDAISGNSFFNFDADATVSRLGIDRLRLGFEAARRAGERLAGDFESSESEDDRSLDAQALRACLEARTADLRSTLAGALGGDSALFYALYASIWPQLNEPADDAFDRLLSLDSVPYSELERPWQFVTEGWGDVDES